MPTYELTGPDGKTYQITPPAGATEADVKTQIARITGASPAPIGARQRSIANRLNPQPLTETETSTPIADVARQEIPPAAGTLATLGAGALPALARVGIAGITALTASKTLGGSGSEALQQGTAAGVGESLVPVIGSVAGQTRDFFRAVTRQAARSEVGRELIKKASDSIVGKVLGKMAGSGAPEVAAEEARDAYGVFKHEFLDQSIQMLGDAAQSATRHPNPDIYLGDIAKKIKTSISPKEVSQGFLQRYGGLDSDALKTHELAVAAVDAAKSAEKATGKPIEQLTSRVAKKAQAEIDALKAGASVDPKAAARIQELQDAIAGGGGGAPNAVAKKELAALKDSTDIALEQKLDSLKAIKDAFASNYEHVSAVVNLRGKISQALYDEDIPQEVRRVLRSVDLKGLDERIVQKLSKGDPAAAKLYKTYLDFYASRSAILEEAVFKSAVKHPEKLADFITPNVPETVNVLRTVAEQSGSKTMVEDVQRQLLSNLVEKNGLPGLGKALGEYGQETIGSLYREPKAAAALKTLLDASKTLAEKVGQPGVASAIAAQRLQWIMGKAAVGAAVGGEAGYKTQGGPVGALAGALTGAGAMMFGQRALVNLALRDPGAARQLVAGIGRFMENGGDLAATALAKRLAAAMISPGAKRVPRAVAEDRAASQGLMQDLATNYGRTE